MTALPFFPGTLLVEGKLLWELMGNLIGGGQTLGGAMPVAKLDGGGLWKASLTEFGLRTANQRRTWRALSAYLDGGAQPVVVPVHEVVDAPYPIVNGVALTSLPDVPHSDLAPFDDDTEYVSSTMEIVAVTAAALRATAMTVDVVAGGDLMGGEYFSIDHLDLRWRLYRIRTALDNGDGTWDITFRPPLRGAVAAATPLEFDRPQCVMRLAKSDAMDVVMERPYYANPSINFIESFPPFPE